MESVLCCFRENNTKISLWKYISRTCFFDKYSHNCRMRTHQYRDIIASVCDSKHLSAEDIFDMIKKTHPKIGRATIYRNIECMFLEWRLRKIPGVNGKAYYEYNPEPHAHLVDDRTKIFCDFPLQNVLVKNIPSGYEIAEICIYIKKNESI